MPGYRYRIYTPDGDEVGVYETLAWNWKVGDVLELHSGQGRWRIVKIVGLDETDDSSGKYQARRVWGQILCATRSLSGGRDAIGR